VNQTYTYTLATQIFWPNSHHQGRLSGSWQKLSTAIEF